MGCTKISATMIYARVAPDYLKGAMNRLRSKFGKNGTKVTKALKIKRPNIALDN